MIVGELYKTHRDGGCLHCKLNTELYWFQYSDSNGTNGALFCLSCFKYAFYLADHGQIEEPTLNVLLYAYNMLQRSPWYNHGIAFEVDE